MSNPTHFCSDSLWICAQTFRLLVRKRLMRKYRVNPYGHLHACILSIELFELILSSTIIMTDVVVGGIVMGGGLSFFRMISTVTVPILRDDPPAAVHEHRSCFDRKAFWAHSRSSRSGRWVNSPQCTVNAVARNRNAWSLRERADKW